MIYQDLEHAEQLGKKLIAIPIKNYKFLLKCREFYIGEMEH